MEQKTAFAKQLRRNQTDVEKLLWKYLRNRRLNGVKFRRQHPISPFIVDFVSLENRLIIELDGGQHNTNKGKKKDKSRILWLEKKGYQVIRFWNNELISDLDAVLAVIQNALTLPSPKRALTSNSSPKGRGQKERDPGRGEKGGKIL